MDGFVIYREIADKVKMLSDAQAGEVLKMAAAYAFDGELQQTDDLAVALVFADVKSDIDRAAEKYERICERNRENGQKGGRPKTQQNPKEPKETQWDILGTQRNPTEPKETQKNQNLEHRTYNSEYINTRARRNPKIQRAFGFSTERTDVNYDEIARRLREEREAAE